MWLFLQQRISSISPGLSMKKRSLGLNFETSQWQRSLTENRLQRQETPFGEFFVSQHCYSFVNMTTFAITCQTIESVSRMSDGWCTLISCHPSCSVTRECERDSSKRITISKTRLFQNRFNLRLSTEYYSKTYYPTNISFIRHVSVSCLISYMPNAWKCNTFCLHW